MSPSLNLQSQAWDTTALTSKTSNWKIEDMPLSGNPISGVLRFGNSIDGAASTFPMAITSGGYVGIGTTSPVAPLTVDTASGGTPVMLALRSQFGGADEGSQIAFQSTTSSNFALIGGFRGTASTEGYLNFTTKTGGVPSERMRIDPSGNVGIGTTAPAAKLEVAGNIKVGDSGAVTCDATTKGSMRYNNTNNVMEFCNGTTWSLMQAPSCTDTTPNAFSFSNQANQALSTLITSDIIQVTGMNCAINTSVSGPGSPAYRTCSDASCTTVVQDWTTGTSSISSGQYMQLRQTSSASGGVTQYATVIAGASASAWSVATAGDCSGLPATPPPVGTVCADGTVYAGMSPDGNVPMFTQRCDLGMSWDGTNCIGARWTQTWNNGTSVYTGYTNVVTGKANSAAIAVLADTGAPYTAAINCENLNENGHTDWYLPAREELFVLITGNAAIKNFNTIGWYWASSEGNTNQSWVARIFDGASNVLNKTSAYYVRCVRR